MAMGTETDFQHCWPLGGCTLRHMAASRQRDQDESQCDTNAGEDARKPDHASLLGEWNVMASLQVAVRPLPFLQKRLPHSPKPGCMGVFSRELKAPGHTETSPCMQGTKDGLTPA